MPHIKLQEGGRPAPRIHVFDDTAGASRKLYVRYFGEHLINADTRTS